MATSMGNYTVIFPHFEANYMALIPRKNDQTY